MLKAEADEKVYAVEAAGKQALHEAENVLRDEQVALQRSLAILKVLPEIVANAVKPLENIEGIKILQGYGSGVTGQLGAASDGAGVNGGIAEQVTSAALNYRANAPVVDAMLRELGLVDAEKGGLNDLLSGNNMLTHEALQIARDTKASVEPKVETVKPVSQNNVAYEVTLDIDKPEQPRNA